MPDMPTSLIQKGSGLQVVIGLGGSGLSAARYLCQEGYRVAVTDAHSQPPLAAQLPEAITTRCFGEIDADLLLQAERIVISPGISLDTPAVRAAITQGIPVVSDIQLFRDACQAPIIAITGSNAKSTVTTLVGQMAADAGINVGVGGNIGIPALDLLSNKEMALAVLELSSFQLETVSKLGAKVACVLNMSPDHLDRHGDMLSYHQAKHRIFQGAQSVVVNRDDALTRPLVADDVPRLSIGIQAPDTGQYGLIVDADGQTHIAQGTTRLLSADELPIKGQHNLLNAQAALALGELAGIPLESMLETLRQFEGLPHRCQYIDSVKGIDYFNDSKGTNIGSTMAAIVGLGAVYAPKDGTLLVILGGQGKGQDFDALAPLMNRYVSQVICIGEDAALIEQHLHRGRLNSDIEVHQCADLVQAFACVAQVTKSSLSQVQAVLLSPACASFDQYSGYAARGTHFIELVHDAAQTDTHQM